LASSAPTLFYSGLGETVSLQTVASNGQIVHPSHSSRMNMTQ